MKLRPFQTRFVKAATAPAIETAALTLPRGNGKSWLAGELVRRAMTPGDPLFVVGSESVLVAASIEQAKIVFRFARAGLEAEGGYRFLDSATRAGIMHRATNTRLRVVGSNGKTAMGLVNCPLVVADEPGAWEVNGGQLLHDAIQTAQGKPGSPLRAVYIGTLAPATSGWWHELVEDGSHGSVHVQALRGDPDRWDQWPEIRRCNPLTAISESFRRKLLEERDSARRDSRLKARFLSYRLNVPTADTSTVLLGADEFRLACRRDVPAPIGRPIVGVDLGYNRAWSAAVALWGNGRCDAVAVCPGIPSIEDQERRDRVSAGTYGRLVDAGLLRVAEGLRVPPVQMLVEAVRERWGAPDHLVSDRARLDELRDAARGTVIVDRVTRWFGAAEDIRAVRRLVMDGPLAPVRSARPLLAASLAVARVKNDDQGSTRLVKRDNNTGRDDVAAALVLAAGALQRYLARPRSGGAYLGLVG